MPSLPWRKRSVVASQVALSVTRVLLGSELLRQSRHAREPSQRMGARRRMYTYYSNVPKASSPQHLAAARPYSSDETDVNNLPAGLTEWRSAGQICLPQEEGPHRYYTLTP